MNNLINQICAMDDQIRKNKETIEFISTMAKYNLVDLDMANKVIELGELTKHLLIEQYKLKNKLFNEYGIFYV